MSKFMDIAAAAESVVRMLDRCNCGYVSLTIFEDGSGSITVDADKKDRAVLLMREHGIDLSMYGRRDLDNPRDYHFSVSLDELRKYSESLCPHCGKDTEVPK